MTGLFDEEAAKEHGMAVAAVTHAEILNWLRPKLVELYSFYALGDLDAYVTADDARRLIEDALDTGELKQRPECMNFMGSVFKGGEWEFTGKRVRSRTAGSHGNELRCWKWIGG